MGRPSSDLQHPDLGFDYYNLVDINSIQLLAAAAAAAAAVVSDAANLGEGLINSLSPMHPILSDNF